MTVSLNYKSHNIKCNMWLNRIVAFRSVLFTILVSSNHLNECVTTQCLVQQYCKIPYWGAHGYMPSFPLPVKSPPKMTYEVTWAQSLMLDLMVFLVTGTSISGTNKKPYRSCKWEINTGIKNCKEEKAWDHWSCRQNSWTHEWTCFNHFWRIVWHCRKDAN